MNRTDLISELRAQILGAPTSELPSIRGELAALEAELLVRLTTLQAAAPSDDDAGEDQLIDVAAAAKKLGMSTGYVRKHADKFGRVNLPGNALRFSNNRLDAIIKRRSYNNN